MNRLIRFATLAFSVITLTACGQQTTGATNQVPKNAQEVTVVASNWKWTLSQRTFKSGVPIDFVVTSTDGGHGFAIDNTNVSQPVAPGDEPHHVVWTPPAPGQYKILCDVYCCAGHPDME